MSRRIKSALDRLAAVLSDPGVSDELKACIDKAVEQLGRENKKSSRVIGELQGHVESLEAAVEELQRTCQWYRRKLHKQKRMVRVMSGVIHAQTVREKEQDKALVRLRLEAAIYWCREAKGGDGL